ncbi:sensor histidine kinase, partial [Pseudomonas aeruginosa]
MADWQEGQGIACELRLGGPLPPLDAAAGTHLYRLLQEALNNVARHAGASRVRIRLQRRGGFLSTIDITPPRPGLIRRH